MMPPIIPIINALQNSIRFVSTLGNESRRLNADIRGSLRSISLELELIQKANENYEDLQTQELVYEIEGFIDRLWIPGKNVGFVLSGTGTDPRPADIDSLKHYKEDIKTVRQRSSESIQSQSKAFRSAQFPSYTPEKDLVGFPDTKYDLMKLLFPPAHDGQPRPTHDMELIVISILGCIGSGKTAVARAVYEDRTVVAGAFDCKAWVVVSKHNDQEDPLANTIEDILQQVRSSFKAKIGSSAASSSNITSEEDDQIAEGGELSTSEALRRFLRKKRYLVCIDDVQQKEMWDKMKVVFPEDEVGSRILVTTNVRPIADACSRGSYVYKMQCLDRPNSEKLLWLKALGPSGEPSEAVADGSKSIFVKCDGLPLALISAGNYLNRGESHLTMSACYHVGKELGDYLGGNESAFAEIKRVLVQCYDNLPTYNHKNCLLYASIFPRGHQIDSKSVARRLISEELVDKDVDKGISEALGLACKCFKELINQSMIEKVLIHHNSEVVERCKVQSIILEFSLNMSLSKNFVTLIDEHGTIRNKRGRVRRLISVQSSTEDVSDLKNDDLSTVRSFTIFKRSLLQRAPEFKKCSVLRVLDLEGCTGLDNGVLDDICRLVLLKYLGLRRTDVKQLPRNVQHLRLLQTLDIRETRVENLSMEVIMLPSLAYLFGKFELQWLTDTYEEQRRFMNFLSTESNLLILAGILINGSKVFEVVIEHARMLKKVVIWCKENPAQRDKVQPKRPAPSRLPDSVPRRFRKKNKFASGHPSGQPSVGSSDPGSSTQDPAIEHVTSASLVETLDSTLRKRPIEIGLESLSIDFNGVSNEFLGFLKTANTISSIKVRQALGDLPDSDELSKVRNLNKLHLFSTGRSIEELGALQSLPCLEYLKLGDNGDDSWDGNFDVKANGFNSLHWLCFEASMYPRISIEDGGMRRLTSLLLLCPNSPPLKEEAKYEMMKMEETAVIEEDEKSEVKGISYLKNLNEVILHRSAPDTMVEAWKTTANLHRNKPYVKKQPCVEEEI